MYQGDNKTLTILIACMNAQYIQISFFKLLVTDILLDYKKSKDNMAKFWHPQAQSSYRPKTSPSIIALGQ